MAKGTYYMKIVGIPQAQRKFMLRIAMTEMLRKKCLEEVGRFLVQEMKRRAPAYPLSMLKHGKRKWKITGALKRSIKYEITAGGDLLVGPHKSEKGYRYKQFEKWRPLEFGHPSGYYDERPFVRPALEENISNIRYINRKWFSKATK